MRQRSLIIVLALAGVVGGSLLLEGSSDFPRAAIETIDRDQLRSALYFLASDALEGRDTGSRGNEIATAYLAHRFELMGLEPAGDGGTYRQSVPLVSSELGEPNRLSVRHHRRPAEGIFAETFYPSPLSASARVTAPAVFAGYGITAPDFGYDDYAGVEVAGKVVIVLEGEPEAGDAFLGGISTEYGRTLHKILNAQQHGAAAVVIADIGSRRGFNRSARSSWPVEASRDRFQLGAWTEAIRIPAAHATAELLEPLPLGEGTLVSLKQAIDGSLEPRSGELAGVEVVLETNLVRSITEVSNVLARVSGSDPELSRETVIVGAHLDHVGARGDRIYNGADDDASGTVAVLEIAEAFAQSPTRPRRSVLFALWNAEERGLLGARHFLFDADGGRPDIAAMLQLDMVGRNEEVPSGEDRRFRGLRPQTAEENENTLQVIGYSFSDDMRGLVESANSITGLTLEFELDQHPISLLTRSDHWPFLAEGIPALFFTSGLHPDYHQPTDTADKINYPKLERVARLAFAASWEMANRRARPQLNGDGSRP